VLNSLLEEGKRVLELILKGDEEPGTAKSWLSEHLAAAINGDSTKGVQGTAGTTEEQIRYTWNYAMLIARGPSNEWLIKSPIFRELRAGQTLDGKNKVETPSGVLSTAEAISLLANSMALSGNFGDGSVSDNDIASGLQGAVIQDDDKDLIVWKDYLANVMKKRGASWRGLYSACQAHVGE